MFLTKIGDYSRLKTVVGGKHGHALRKRQKALKTYLIKKFVNELAISPRQLLNEQGCEKSLEFEVTLGSWNVESFCERGTEVCEHLRKRRVICATYKE